MPLGLQLMCSGINWRDMRVHPIETVLVNDILLMLGRAPQPTPRPAAAPLRARTYAVGDYYNENDKKGIIFEVDATGRHGKIMAMRDLPEELEWCTKEEYDKRVKIGVEDEKDGMKNLQIIRQIPGWWRKYPAFAGCAALGEGWYLPAKKELEKLGDNWKSLSEKAEYFGGEGLVKIRRWSSSEAHSKSAWFVLFGFGSGCMGVSNFKFYAYRVRAVAAF